MKWADNIKAGIGRKMLAGKASASSRKVNVCNLDDAKNIGIIYNATEYVSFEIVRDLVRQLSNNKAAISVLGYVDSKKLIDHYLYRKGFDFFSKNDLNWYNKPVSSVAEQFMKEPFDLLMNLSLDDHFPIHFITAVSPASFKAGRYSLRDSSLDFMIDIEKEKQTMLNLHRDIMHENKAPVENQDIEADVEKKTEIEFQLKFLIDQLLHYLSILKK
jgi:hypothetical protein